ncbi:hypothetical protein DFJ74DRAFT_602098 [Hyaloraphidium curvatum]|nr:hypothetical protein DFJ74DRAFT_602098 [Hyaloraphidium curvatum]
MAPESSRSPLFKQRWVAKRETRAYHWDHITERQFLLRHFTPRIKLPDMGAADRHLYPPTAMLCYAELERRLDIVVHRCLFAPSVWAARALVVQGHVKVNGTTVTRPSTSLRDGDIITVDPAAIALLTETGKPLEFCEVPFMGPWMFVPEYLEVDYNICSAVFLRAPTLHPGRCEVPTPWPPEHHALTFEWYSRIYNRKTKRAPPEPLMIHGQPVRLKEKFVKIVEREARDRNAFFQRSLADAERERILETAKMVQSPARPAGSPSASL